MDANVYQHFRKDEHPFIDLVSSWQEQVENQYSPYLTDFLDPRQIYIVENLIRQNSELKFSFYGGYEAAERKRALIYPDYFESSLDDYEISLYEIVYPMKFAKLSHGKVLGTLLGTGVKRGFFGDIISDGEHWQVFLKSEIANYITNQLDKIGNIAVRLEKRNYTEIIRPKDSWEPARMTVSSLRLDVVVAAVYNISRQRSKQLVEAGKIKVNWMEQERPDYQLDILDVISVRGFGRFQIQTIEGKTKKDKIRLFCGVLRK